MSLASTFLFIPRYTFIRDAEAQETGAVLKVVPSNVTAGSAPFTIAVKVYNVTNLYSWQVMLHFDDSIANTTAENVWLPSDIHVFNYTTSYLLIGPFIEYQAHLPAYPLYNDTNIFTGASLLGDAPTFNGTGTLFMVRFTGTASGTTMLRIVTEHTKLKEYTVLGGLTDIPYTVENGQVTVTMGPTPGKAGSSISINVDPPTVTIGNNVTISGAINVTRPNVDVTIKYRPVGGAWSTLAVVKTNSTSGYTYTWNTTGMAAGTYEVMASWPGDAETNGAESEAKTVEIQEVKPSQPPLDYTYVAMGIIAVGIIVALALYFVKFRKT
jgi:hypothetical protein